MDTGKYIFHVDAFTAEPLRGNPAGVCILEEEPPAERMQSIAMELNLSETAFVFKKDNRLNIRFYSPASEVELCGHATLSASHVLFENGIVSKEETIVFQSRAGELTVKFKNGLVTMNFPLYSFEEAEIPAGFESITGIKPESYFKSAYGWRLAVSGSESELAGLEPDFSAMKRSDFGDLIVTSPSDDERFDFCLRCFAPALGINEDPVTGSAHCVLVPYWHSRTGKTSFLSKQLSARGGTIRTELLGGRVEIAGQAITVMKSELFI